MVSDSVQGFDAEALEEAWTKQAGFPVTCVESMPNTSYELTQILSLQTIHCCLMRSGDRFPQEVETA